MISKDLQFSFADEDVWEVNLMDNNLVEASVNGGDVQKGKWSTIYNQSLLVELESGMKFVTNFRYNFKGGNPETMDSSKFTGIDVGSYDKFDSQCD